MRPTELVGLLGIGLACSGSPASVETSDGRYAMGSILEITLVGPPEQTRQATFDGLYREVVRLEALASRYEETSALSQLNRAGALDGLDPSLVDLLTQSKRYAELSGGAFDVSVGAWVELWIEAARRGRLPDAEERNSASMRTGSDAFHVGADGRVELAPGARLDLGAIAKGYALDRLAEGLPKPLRGALFNFGQSSYWAIGRPAEGEFWRLLLRDPDGGYAGIVELRGQALSISASLGQSSEIEGRRYGHIVDPRNGEPLHRNAQVAVVAPSAAMAEALSTAALVMGRQAGVAWVETLDECELLWLEGRVTQATAGWGLATRFQTEVK